MPPEDIAVAAPEAAPTAAPQAADAPTPTAGAESAAPDQSEAPKPDATPSKTFTQDEVNKFLAKEVAKQRRRIEREVRTSVENEYLRRQVEGPRPAASAGDSAGDDAPQLKDFPDYEAWVRASARWEARRELQETIKAERTASERRTEAERDAQRRSVIRERIVEKGAALYEDFEEMVSGDVAFTDDMVDALAETETGQGHIAAYYLAQHPEEAERISKLSRSNQVRAVDKLIATLTKPAEPTKAPEPIKPNAGNGSASDTLESLATPGNFDRWLKARNRQLGRT